jgi:CDP-paratose 2-epimerase
MPAKVSKKTVLITGGCGFIGTHTSLGFLADGWEVVALDNLSRTGARKNWTELQALPSWSLAHADIRSANEVKKIVEDVQPQLVIHLAAQVAVTHSVKDPRTDFEINALGTLNILEAVRALNPKPMVIYSSTNKVYGDLGHIDFTEDDLQILWPNGWRGVSERSPLDFYSPYGCSKGVADQYVRDYFRLFQVPSVVFRQSCIYGPRQYGEEDQGWVAWFAIAALKKRPISIYGSGKQVRDLLHVEDLVKLYKLAYAHQGKISGRVFNVGGGIDNALSLLQYLNFLRQRRIEITPRFDSTRPGDQKIFVSDNSAIKQALGWAPSISTTVGLAQMVDDLEARL